MEKTYDNTDNIKYTVQPSLFDYLTEEPTEFSAPREVPESNILNIFEWDHALDSDDLLEMQLRLRHLPDNFWKQSDFE